MILLQNCKRALCHIGKKSMHKIGRCSSTLVVAEHDNKVLNPSTLAAVNASLKLGDVSVLVLGFNSSNVAKDASKIHGIDKVIYGDHKAYEHWLPENTCRGVSHVARTMDFSKIVVASNMNGKNFIGRLAAEMNTAPITDVINIIDGVTFQRPMYAGNAIATVTSTEKIKLISIRPTSFDKATMGEKSVSIHAAPLHDQPETNLSQFVSENISKSDRPDLATARVVVSGGRALKSAENFKILDELAAKLGGTVGASRAAVDAGYVPNELQVGQTGKVVAPELYIAVGISGAIQHVSGMKDSKCIVAINKDKEAPIFSIADYGLVGDLFKIIPELMEKI